MTRLRKTMVAMLVPLVLSGLSAHAAVAPPAPTMLSSDPAEGAKLDSAPGTITMTFEQPLDEHYSTMEVFDQCGNRIDSAELTFTLGQMSVDLKKAPKGKYKVFYIAKSIPKGTTGETTGYLRFEVTEGKACKKGRR